MLVEERDIRTLRGLSDSVALGRIILRTGVPTAGISRRRGSGRGSGRIAKGEAVGTVCGSASLENIPIHWPTPSNKVQTETLRRGGGLIAATVTERLRSRSGDWRGSWEWFGIGTRSGTRSGFGGRIGFWIRFWVGFWVRNRSWGRRRRG